MKAYEMPAKISKQGMLKISSKWFSLLPHDKTIKIIVLIPEKMDLQKGKAWDDLTAKEFFDGYSELDSIYDEL